MPSPPLPQSLPRKAKEGVSYAWPKAYNRKTKTAESKAPESTSTTTGRKRRQENESERPSCKRRRQDPAVMTQLPDSSDDIAVPLAPVTSTVVLDHLYFPHLMDAIIAASPPEVLAKFRATCTLYRDRFPPSHVVAVVHIDSHRTRHDMVIKA
jgi:hypothetical protein